MKGKFISILCGIISLPCLIYYTSKFYLEGHISFGEKSLAMWSIIVGVIIYSLIRLIIVENKLDKMVKMLEDIQETQILNHHEDVKFQKGTRRIIMDVNKKEDSGDNDEKSK